MYSKPQDLPRSRILNNIYLSHNQSTEMNCLTCYLIFQAFPESKMHSKLFTNGYLTDKWGTWSSCQRHFYYSAIVGLVLVYLLRFEKIKILLSFLSSVYSGEGNWFSTTKKKKSSAVFWLQRIIYKYKEQSWPLMWSPFTSDKGWQSRDIVIGYKTAFRKGSKRKSFFYSPMLP